MNGTAKNRTDTSHYEKNKNDIIKIQAFVRSCFCRARVSDMVQKLIDEILIKRERSGRTTKDRGSVSGSEKDDGGTSSVSDSQTKIVMDAGDDTRSLNEGRQLTNNGQEPNANVDGMEHTEHSTSSIGLTEIVPNEIKESFTMNDESMHGSVSIIRSKFETKRRRNAPLLTRKWSNRKAQDDNLQREKLQEEKEQEEKPQEEKPQQEKPQQEKQQKEKPQQEKQQKEEQQEAKQQNDEQPINQEQPPTIEKLELPEGEQKDSELPAEGQKNSFVKNVKLRSNATKHVSSSKKRSRRTGDAYERRNPTALEGHKASRRAWRLLREIW